MRPAEDIRADLEKRNHLELAEQICEEHHLTLADLLSGGRSADLIPLRQHVFHALRGLGVTVQRIAVIFGVDPGSVSFGAGRWADAHHETPTTTPDAIRAQLTTLNLLELAERICAMHGLTVDDLVNNVVAGSPAMTLRHHFYFELSGNLTIYRITKIFGANRSSVYYGVRTWKRALDSGRLLLDHGRAALAKTKAAASDLTAEESAVAR